MTIRRLRAAVASLIVCLALVPCASVAQTTAHDVRLESLIPLPETVRAVDAEPFRLTPRTTISVDPSSVDAVRMAERLAEMLRPATGFPLMLLTNASAPAHDVIRIELLDDASLGDEGYRLRVNSGSATLSASGPAGLFYGIQTIRQLLPSEIESAAAQPADWVIAAAEIVDRPRFEWRGTMLDISRHFFGPETIKHVIDLLSMYKMNRLHLHLSDDQGWRIEIKSWPNLALHGGLTQVGGGAGGFLTQEEYRDIVAYADERFVMIVPEIDMPGHTNAALASYAELNCDDERPELYTGIRVGFSSLCVDREVTYKFVDDVLTELAMLTSGPFLHIGGDEVEKLTQDEYNAFIERVEEIVRSKDRRMIGWDEIAQAELHESTVVQHWRPQAAPTVLERAPGIIMSHSNRMYIDMKYDSTTALGLSWAGLIEVDHAYDWDPMDVLAGYPEARVLGVEAPLWTETIETVADIEYMMFPRVPGFAEMGWTPRRQRAWQEYSGRLASHGDRWSRMGINFYRSPLVDW